jgi:hypothetical protein
MPEYSGWSAVCAFRSPSAHFDVAGAPDGESFAFSATVAQTSAYAPGDYTLYLFALQLAGQTVTDRVELASAPVTILPNVALGAAIDTRSTLRKILAAIDATMLGRATDGELDLISTQFGDRSITRDKAALLEYRSRILAEINRDEAGGKSRAVNILTRFR